MDKRSSAPLRVAVVGCGYFSRFHCAAWQRMPDVELMSLLTLDTEADTAREFQQEYGIDTVYHDIETLFEDKPIDLVDIVSPPHTHASYIRQCIDRGSAVVCQKPFCSSPEEAASIVNLIDARGACVVVHENFRFQPWYQHIKQIISNGTLGRIYEINFNFRPGDGQGEEAYLDRQPYFQTQDRFFIQETGVHIIDVFRFLMGDITGLFARLKKLNPVINGEDAGVVLLDFASGVRGILNGNRLSDHKADNPRLTMGEMRIEASRAVLSLNGDGQIHTRLHGSNDWVEHAFAWADIDFGGDCVYATNRHVAEHLLYGTPVHNLASEYLRNRVIEDAIYRSSLSGTWIEL